MCPRMASKDPGAKSEPWRSLHPDSVLAASRLDLQKLFRPSKWTAQANGVALMHRQTLICPQLPWIHLRQPCERPDLASVRPDLTTAPSRTAFRCSQAPQRSACCGGSVAATEHSRCRSVLFTRALSLTRCSFVLRDRRIVQVVERIRTHHVLVRSSVSPTLFDEVAGDQFYSFVMKCWERRPRCSRSTCRVCGKLSRRPVW